MDELKNGITAKRVAKLLPKRNRNTHKGCYGKSAIVAGSEEFLGAPVLSTKACLRSGAGYTYLFTPIKERASYALQMPEAIILPLSLKDGGAFRGFDAVAIGMGMGVSVSLADFTERVLQSFTGRLILDADALNSLAEYKREGLAKIFANKKCDVLITPHCKEFSRLTGESVEEILQNPVTVAEKYAREWGITVLLKNAYTVITDGAKTVINERGTAGQAKGGSGDLLSGLIAGLCAQGLSAFDGGTAGAYLAGLSAELAEERYGEYSLIATDVIEYLGQAFLRLRVAENADEQGDDE
ncbi:MAG: NAD(P)H-hydrate dehydratase [Clostridiales bacterium]|nr:NAD(P)H-hydrate dehydratase [Clostridiales bacterium]